MSKIVYSTLPESNQLENGYLAIYKAVFRACALYFASCSDLYTLGIEMVSVCTGGLGKEGRVNISVDT